MGHDKWKGGVTSGRAQTSITKRPSPSPKSQGEKMIFMDHQKMEPPSSVAPKGREENCSAGGGGGRHGSPFSQPPPSLLGRRDGRGGFRAGGVPTSMAQNDTHVALIILTTQMWGGGGGNYWWKKLFQAKFCVPVPLAPTFFVLTQNKGPDTEPHFSNPPPLLRRASMSPPPRRAIFRLPSCENGTYCCSDKGIALASRGGGVKDTMRMS